ncbi:MAG: response regulator [Gammaproteobacteria bacterium]|nr:response regulator [Gammaproteobacteria bacterium]
MGEKILFVDDEPNVLQSIRRTLRSKFDVDTAEGGEEALGKLTANGTYAVIVSDMRMPGMNGVELLSQAKQQSPDTVRMMLTGNADQQTAVDAVNHGDIFRFLNKPCESEELSGAITSGIRQHRLITAERDLLENTLQGSIKALTDVLALTNPDVFGRNTRFKHRLRQITDEMGITDTWQLEDVAMLSLIGSMAIREDLLKRKLHGESLSFDELAEFALHAKVGADLLMAIPRMEDIAQSIRYQEKNFDGSGHPRDDVKGGDIPLGARLIKIILDFDAFESSGDSEQAAIGKLKAQAQFYDPAVLSAFENTFKQDSPLVVKPVPISQLTDGMLLADDVVTASEVLLVAKGQDTTQSVRRHLQNYQANDQIGDTVNVWCEAD